MQIDDRYKLLLVQSNALICRCGVVINRFCRPVGRQPWVKKLHTIYKTFSLANDMEHSGMLIVQAICVRPWKLCRRVSCYLSSPCLEGLRKRLLCNDNDKDDDNCGHNHDTNLEV